MGLDLLLERLVMGGLMGRRGMFKSIHYGWLTLLGQCTFLYHKKRRHTIQFDKIMSTHPRSRKSLIASRSRARYWNDLLSIRYVTSPSPEFQADHDQCYHSSDRYNGHYGHDDVVISRLEPFQTTATTFPNLEYLQIGPNLCDECISAVLHLFVGKEFTRAKRYSSTGQLLSESDPGEEGEDNDKAKLPRMAIWEAHGQRNRPNTFNGMNPTASSPRFVDFDIAAAPNLTSLQLFIPAQIKYGHDSDILKGILRLIPPATSIRMFQVWLRENGGWGGMGASGTVNAYVCKDVKVAEEELTEWAKKEKEKNMTVQERLLAKFQADAAKVLPSKRKKEVVAVTEVAEEESVDNKDDDEGTPSEPDVKQEMSDVEAELNGGFSDSEAGHDSNDSKAPKMTNAERHAIYSHRASARQYSPILSVIATALPDLIGLSVRRQGTYMAEITEGSRLLESEVELWVEPLLRLDSLQYLDLGLAISGIKEVSDFPIGLSTTQSRKGRETAKATGNDIQALKRRKYELDIKKAVEEGDKWRLEVLKRFLVPKSNDVPQSLADAESNAGSTSGNANVNGSGNEDEGSVTWPKSLKSGYIYSIDLVNRLRGNGLAIPWKIVGKTVQLGQPRKIKL